jgi:hypothetical protein
VVVLSNFNVTSISVTPNFPYTGLWYNLMDNSTLDVTSTTQPITIEPGGFRVYGNQPAVLNTDTFTALNYVNISPNPSLGYFSINSNLSKVMIYSITGQLVKTFNDKLASDVYEISDLTSGVYLVKLFDDHNNEKTLKLVKQ